jgi:hypothetical protein
MKLLLVQFSKEEFLHSHYNHAYVQLHFVLNDYSDLTKDSILEILKREESKSLYYGWDKAIQVMHHLRYDYRYLIDEKDIIRNGELNISEIKFYVL